MPRICVFVYYNNFFFDGNVYVAKEHSARWVIGKPPVSVRPWMLLDGNAYECESVCCGVW